MRVGPNPKRACKRRKCTELRWFPPNCRNAAHNPARFCAGPGRRIRLPRLDQRNSQENASRPRLLAHPHTLDNNTPKRHSLHRCPFFWRFEQPRPQRTSTRKTLQAVSELESRSARMKFHRSTQEASPALAFPLSAHQRAGQSRIQRGKFQPKSKPRSEPGIALSFCGLMFKNAN